MYRSQEDILEFLKKKDFQKRIDKLAQKYKSKNVIVYGAGMTFDVIKENFNLKELNLTGISDIKFDDGEEYKGIPTIAPESIAKNKPDIVLIAMFEEDIANEFFEEEIFPEYGKFKTEPFIKTTFIETVKELFNS